MRPMTLTEKILARAAARQSVEPGQNLLVDVDVLMTHDVCGPGTIGVFKREFGADARVWDPERVVIIPDHYIFTSARRANRNVDILRDFARDQQLPYFYDVAPSTDNAWRFDASRGLSLAQYGEAYAGFDKNDTYLLTCNRVVRQHRVVEKIPAEHHARKAYSAIEYGATGHHPQQDSLR